MRAIIRTSWQGFQRSVRMVGNLRHRVFPTQNCEWLQHKWRERDWKIERKMYEFPTNSNPRELQLGIAYQFICCIQVVLVACRIHTHTHPHTFKLDFPNANEIKCAHFPPQKLQNCLPQNWCANEIRLHSEPRETMAFYHCCFNFVLLLVLYCCQLVVVFSTFHDYRSLDNFHKIELQACWCDIYRN